MQSDELRTTVRPVRAAGPVRGPASGGATADRRTVTIRGHGSDRPSAVAHSRAARRRPERRHERSGFRPDRAAMWAVLLGLMLIVAAATSAHADVLHAAWQQHAHADVLRAAAPSRAHR